MTIHIAAASGNHAVLLSDSQGSSNEAESHGWHKQFIGRNFVVGLAGADDVCSRLFSYLHDRLGLDRDIGIGAVMRAIEGFYRKHMRASYLANTSVIAVGYDDRGSVSVQQYYPGKFKTFGKPTHFGSIGSGSTFVDRAKGRDQKLGLNIPHTELEDKLIAALYYADAAIESLTVDDSFAVAILDSGRSYLTGDRTLSLRYVPEPIIQFWNQVSACWKPMQVTIATMNSELESVHRRFSNIRSGLLTGMDLKELERSNLAILANRQKLVEQLAELKKTYEELILGDHPAQFT